MKYRAVIFDMDGLLLDTERIARWAWQKAAAERGYDLSDELYGRAVGRPVDDTLRIFRAVLGATFPAESVREKRVEYADGFMQKEGVPLKAGAKPLLEFLRSAGVPCALATSTRREPAGWRLELAGVAGYFTIIVAGEDVVRGKPHPDIFLSAADRLGVPPQDCLVLEDSESGARGGQAAGMDVVIVPDLVPPAADVRDLAVAVLASLGEVQDWLMKNRANGS